MSTTESLYLVSDLANKRREVLAPARTGTAVVRDTDGFTLAFLPKDPRRNNTGLLRRVARVEGVVPFPVEFVSVKGE